MQIAVTPTVQLAQQGALRLAAARLRRRQLTSVRRSPICRAEQRDGEQQEPPTVAKDPAAAPPAPQQEQQQASPAQQDGGPEKLSGADAANLQLPQEVIQRLRDTVFSFDSFFVTSVENYQADGVLFKGNLRGDADAAYKKLTARLKEQLGDAYKLYLLENQEAKPVAVVLPVSAVQPQVSPAAEAGLAALFGVTTLATTLNINGAELFNAALLTASWDPAAVEAAVPGTLAFLAILATHEAGHSVAAKQRGLELAPPLFIPAGLGLLGAFGAITRIKGFVPNRTSLAAVAAAGPLPSAALSAAVMLAGAVLSAQGAGGVELDVASFKESLLAGALGRAAFGDQLFRADAVSCHPLFVAGWAGLIINAINCLPAGELDGGRAFLGLFGRRAASRMGAVTLLLLGLAGFANSLALFWLLLVLTLQRGPIPPCDEELSPIEDAGTRNAAIAALLLPLLVLLPYPEALSFTNGLPDLPPTF